MAFCTGITVHRNCSDKKFSIWLTLQKVSAFYGNTMFLMKKKTSLNTSPKLKSFSMGKKIIITVGGDLKLSLYRFPVFLWVLETWPLQLPFGLLINYNLMKDAVWICLKRTNTVLLLLCVLWSSMTLLLVEFMHKILLAQRPTSESCGGFVFVPSRCRRPGHSHSSEAAGGTPGITAVLLLVTISFLDLEYSGYFRHMDYHLCTPKWPALHNAHKLFIEKRILCFLKSDLERRLYNGLQWHGGFSPVALSKD